MPLIRARDVRTYIAELGYEKGIVQSLERLLDDYAETKQQMRQLVELTSQCIDELGKLTQVGIGLRSKIEEIERVRQQGDQHGEHQS